MSPDDGGRTRAAYGEEKDARLQRIKAVDDPANPFHGNMSITPA